MKCFLQLGTEQPGTKKRREKNTENSNTAVLSVFPWTGSGAMPKYRGAFENYERAEVCSLISSLSASYCVVTIAPYHVDIG
jgi:hypothetical protein